MTNKRDILKSPVVEPVYHQSSPNEDLLLGSFEADLSSNNFPTTINAQCSSQLIFLPSCRCRFNVPAPEESLYDQFRRAFGLSQINNLKLTIPKYGTSLDAIPMLLSQDEWILGASREPTQIHKPCGSISRAIFHLFNWPDFIGPQDYILEFDTPNGRRCSRRGRITLEIDGWQIVVTGVKNTDELIKRLRETGGYAITHCGSVERIDGVPFSSDQLEDLLTFLTYFFAFILGKWSSPSLTIGFDSSGSRVYEEWGTRRCDQSAWNGNFSWFDRYHTELARTLAPGFHQLWNNVLWRKPLSEAIYWYVNANRGAAGLGVDSALLFSQAALELLAWTHCVLDRKMVTADAFKTRGLSASNKLRLLASSLDIPLEIPQSLVALHAKRGKPWDDSMDAITDIRNRLVHPGKEVVLPEGAYFDAWRLSMWYLDLILLRLFGYQGSYGNRLSERSVGHLELVPWCTGPK